MEMMNPKEIKTHPKFEMLFPIKDELLQAIEEDMRENKFDLSQHIILATWEGQKDPLCIDGHTKLQAAKNVGIEEVPVWLHEFDTEEEAFEKAIKLQCHRRNLPDGQIMYYIGLVDAVRAQKGNRRSSTENSMPQSCGNKGGRSASAKEIAETVGCSPRKVEQLRTVMNHADHEIIEAVKKGEMSGNRAYQETQKKRKEAQAAESRPEDAQTELHIAEDEQNSEEGAETSQQVTPDADADRDDDQADPAESGRAEPEEPEDLDVSIGCGELAEEDGYITVRIRLAQYEALSQYDLTPEEAIDECLEYRKQEDDYDRAEYEAKWAGGDDDSQDDVPEVDAA